MSIHCESHCNLDATALHRSPSTMTCCTVIDYATDYQSTYHCHAVTWCFSAVIVVCGAAVSHCVLKLEGSQSYPYHCCCYCCHSCSHCRRYIHRRTSNATCVQAHQSLSTLKRCFRVLIVHIAEIQMKSAHHHKALRAHKANREWAYSAQTRTTLNAHWLD